MSSSPIASAVKAAALDLDALVARVDALMAEEICWFGVRHHSPAIARQLDRCIRERRPKIIFIEGPTEAQGMIEFVIDSKTRPPIAIYSSYRPTAAPPVAPGQPPQPPPRVSAWYPLVSYSPEYVAMKAARDIGAEAHFNDLPHFATPGEMPLLPNDEKAPQPKPRPREHWEQIATRSDFYQALSKAAGHRNFNETWDRLFESPRADDSYESMRRDVALFCAAVRATTSPALLETDGTLARERFMWRTIQQTLKERKLKPRDAMVICGGFHLFLNRDDPTPPPEIPEGTISVTVAPYSYFRISELSGYGAGNRAPKYYELCHEHHAAGRGQDDVVVDTVIDILKEARRRGAPLSSADAIGATQHALMLSRLRGWNEPVLDDIHDALITCCCKGPVREATSLLEAIDEINIGSRLGKVTDRMGRLPIVNDFYEQLDRLKLEEFAARERLQNYTLDKRDPLDAARSAFLHRLIFMKIEIGQLTREAAPFGQSVFKELWRLKWHPKIETDLIELNLHGDSVEAAATTLLAESLGANAQEAGPACRKLVQAVEMDLPQLVLRAEQNTSYAIDHDERFSSLADALTSLMVLERYAAFRGLGKQHLADLISRCFSRACSALPGVASVPPDQWDEVVTGLMALAEPVVQRDDLDADLFAAQVQLAARNSAMPFLRGAFLGALAEMRRMKADNLATELLNYARGGTDQQVVAGDFLHGVLKVSKTAVMLGGKSLVAAVDELLRITDGDVFLGMVPRLRAAFETLHERQREGLASHVAEIYGLKEAKDVQSLATSVGAAALMSQLDAEVAKIMKEWLGEEAAHA
ncbi:MAG TPA: DUF5682 family protein [Humisphaera sp.]|jgi:hypothetical protein|nr:DUF5682 family protein [Humisphaera sp.]